MRDAVIYELETILGHIECGALQPDNIDAYLYDRLGRLYPPDYQAYSWRWENRRRMHTTAGNLPTYLRHQEWQAVREELAAVLAEEETDGARVQALLAVLLEE